MRDPWVEISACRGVGVRMGCLQEYDRRQSRKECRQDRERPSAGRVLLYKHKTCLEAMQSAPAHDCSMLEWGKLPGRYEVLEEGCIIPG